MERGDSIYEPEKKRTLVFRLKCCNTKLSNIKYENNGQLPSNAIGLEYECISLEAELS